MNTSTTPRRRRHPITVALAAMAALSLTAAACGDDDEDDAAAARASDPPATTPSTGAPGTEPMSDDTMSDETMADDTMSDDTMSDDTMADDTMADDTMDDDMSAMAPSGPACSAVPADGEGSFGGMADDPAATAASNNPILSTLVSAVTQAGLVDTLNGDGPFTIFAPTNEAFAAIPAADLEAVLADTDLLTSILTYHVVAGQSLSSADLVDAGSVTTVNGADLEITDQGGALTVNGVASVCMDVPTANATVHIIGGVLLPA